jgi:cysteine desulfuration protein SufE
VAPEKIMETMKELEQEIIKEFEKFPDIGAKYAHLFAIGEALPMLDMDYKTEENLVDGCQSKLWFFLSVNDGKYYLAVDSDSLVIKGIAALIVRLVDGRTRDEIQQISMDFIDELEIWKLPSERNNGLMAMLEHLRTQANL